MTIESTLIGDRYKVDYAYRGVKMTKYTDSSDILDVQPAADVLRGMKWAYRFCRIFGGTIMGMVFDKLYEEEGMLLSYEPE